ncbi:helix-turn-helix transcriptional regulator [Kordiimonas marina]|uniref:helix-turn-helix transcriptional regulator n=1 Tax=Kordiimonas marina TaxID=2872312 RepID=UPI003CCFF408|nr:helix-turn-helix domain-containing protein [Kordiimonas marina]
MSDKAEYISAREVANLFGVSTSTVYRWERTGRLPRPLRFSGGVVRWHRKEIHNWLSNAPARHV